MTSGCGKNDKENQHCDDENLMENMTLSIQGKYKT